MDYKNKKQVVIMKKTVAVLIILSLMIGCFCVFANGEDSITGTFKASSEMLADKAEDVCKAILAD